MVKFDALYACPSLPCKNGVIIGPSELYHYELPNESKDLFGYEDVWKYNFSDENYHAVRNANATELMTCLKHLSPYLAVDSSRISLEEPILHLLFAYFSNFLLDCANV